MPSNEIIVSDIRNSIQVLAKNYRESKEMDAIEFETTKISMLNFECDCYDIMNDVMFSFRVPPESISFENSYCIFEHEGLFFWIGFNIDYNDKINITVFFETDFNDFKFSRPHMNISDRCDGWAEDGMFLWMNDI